MKKDNTVLIASLILTSIFIILGIFYNELLNKTFSNILNFTLENFGWFYVSAATLFLAVCVLSTVFQIRKH
ncbi:BCCT family transporter [Ammoniphilus sp. 3BR4]|uniref:BCCT family transporter n=1 Tax=Ammoniphilus sp. 3BR4 TaxID=3158265 RepID=UPI0034650333